MMKEIGYGERVGFRQGEEWVTDQTRIMEMVSVRCLVMIVVLRGQDLFLCTVTKQE